MTQWQGEEDTPPEVFEESMRDSGKQLGWKLPAMTAFVALIVVTMIIQFVIGWEDGGPPVWQSVLVFGFFVLLLFLMVWQLVVVIRPPRTDGALQQGTRRKAGLLPSIAAVLMLLLLFGAPSAIAISDGDWPIAVGILALPAILVGIWIYSLVITRKTGTTPWRRRDGAAAVSPTSAIVHGETDAPRPPGPPSVTG